MVEPQPTASALTPVLIGVYNFLRKMGLQPRMTQIHNKSDVPIYLIPFSCQANVDPRTSSSLNKDKIRVISARQSILVLWSDYDCVDARSELRILFRARKKGTDNYENFLRLASNEVRSRKDTLHPHNYLFGKRDLFLEYDDDKVTAGEKAGPQLPPASEETNDGPQGEVLDELLRELTKDLKDDVKALKADMAILKEAFKRIGSKWNKDCTS